MKHRQRKVKLDRATDQRIAIIRSLVTALLWHGKVVTTETRAKLAQPVAEQLITIAKSGTLAARQRAERELMPVGLKYEGQSEGKPLIIEGGRGQGTRRTAVKRLFDDVAPQYKDRAGGYTRIVRLGAKPPRMGSHRGGLAVRRGDGAVLVKLELVDFEA